MKPEKTSKKQGFTKYKYTSETNTPVFLHIMKQALNWPLIEWYTTITYEKERGRERDRETKNCLIKLASWKCNLLQDWETVHGDWFWFRYEFTVDFQHNSSAFE